ncbi:limonene-1,2-epoxide hydrolase family protein [Pseudonocardia sp. Cha107L01]|jgi:limonene-1,2-epoxide hydrolase|uniref:limonene-1,2-epoxide hydrolase family protein n=1 Tax=Pseudonocardia sp. Cha107L01 TaxID=3457576 RepID=UPI00403E8A6F
MTVPNTEPNTEPSPAPSAAAGVSATTTAGSVATVKAFLDALGRLDTDGALALLADDVVYQNVSLPKANGKAAVAKQLGLFGRYCKGFEAINHRIVGDGDTVLTERTDIIEIGRVRSEFWVCGTFEVRDGKIVLWRDYFDWANIIAGTAKGAGRALVGLAKSLRR